jgi:uncharacterized FlaG/YvyC family protein
MKVLKSLETNLIFTKGSTKISSPEKKEISEVQGLEVQKRESLEKGITSKKQVEGLEAKPEKSPLEENKNLESLLKKLRERLNPLNKVLKVEIDKDLNVPIFKIIDEDTQEVIRQIPWEEALKLWKALEELLEKEGFEEAELKGIFLEKEV